MCIKHLVPSLIVLENAPKTCRPFSKTCCLSRQVGMFGIFAFITTAICTRDITKLNLHAFTTRLLLLPKLLPIAPSFQAGILSSHTATCVAWCMCILCSLTLYTYSQPCLLPLLLTALPPRTTTSTTSSFFPRSSSIFLSHHRYHLPESLSVATQALTHRLLELSIVKTDRFWFALAPDFRPNTEIPLDREYHLVETKV